LQHDHLDFEKSLDPRHLGRQQGIIVFLILTLFEEYFKTKLGKNLFPGYSPFGRGGPGGAVP